MRRTTIWADSRCCSLQVSRGSRSERLDMPANRDARRARSVAILHLLLAAVLMATVVGAAPAAACPRCAEGITARSEVWNSGFGFNLLVTVMPFLIIGVVSFAAERIGRPCPETQGERS